LHKGALVVFRRLPPPLAAFELANQAQWAKWFRLGWTGKGEREKWHCLFAQEGSRTSFQARVESSQLQDS